MKELQYPFDSDYIMLKKKKIRTQLLSDEKVKGYTKKKIAILGGSTTNDIKLILELFLLNNEICPEFYESEYNKYYEDAMFYNETLESFEPDVIYICTSNRNIEVFPELADTQEIINQKLDMEAERFIQMWTRLEAVYKCPIIQNNFEMPFYRLLGNKDASDIHGKTNFISRLNSIFYEYAQKHNNFYICDINYISADYGLKSWAEPFYWYMYKYAMNVAAIPSLSFNVANIIKSIFGKNKKGIVLDLDNTLWGGVVGDDGVEGLNLGNEMAESQAYLEFQEYIKKHKELGIILNISSKNDYENAIAGLNHPDSVLKPDDFVEIKANWDSKAENFKQIADELTLLPESLVFVDDNPAERELVTSSMSGVAAPELTEVQDYVQLLDRSGFFEITSISQDDLQRNKMYKKNIERIKQQQMYSNYEDYLISLKMTAKIESFKPLYVARIAQLTNKSNQFNLTTKRYTQAEIEKIAVASDYITLQGRLEDKFGDNGIVSVVIGHIADDVCNIELWIMSCRVLKRDMEYAMFDKLVEACKNKGIHRLKGCYYPTAKNSMVADFYELLGFSKVSEDDAGNTEWTFEISGDYVNKNTVIRNGGD